jgi:glycine/D-amino acid oxidase-like deaminating enzyme/nitrite reductase/ring-hydroxylating ferredoxin subunit
MSQSKSAWDDAQLPQFSKLAKDGDYDVVVIGGGITGLTAAYLLKKAGKQVCLLERDRLGRGDTGCTTAHLTCVTDLRLAKMARLFGKDTARAVWEGGAAAINTIEAIAAAENIECEFHRIPGFLHASLEKDGDEKKELEADCKLAQELGFSAALMSHVPLLHRRGIRFPNQAKFHPLRYLAGLAKAIDGDGSAIYERSEAAEFLEKPHGVKVNGKRVKCGYIVIATHVPLMGKTGLVNATLFQTKLAPYSSYVVGATISKGELPEASFWDTSDPYYYLRIDGAINSIQGQYAILGGKDHKTGQKADLEKRFTELGKLLKQIIPQAKVDRRWSGQVIETNDGLPYIGETAKHQFAATGFSGNGMTFGTLAAMMACDAALGRKNPWQDVFSVSRKKLRGGTWNFLTENLDYPYYLVRDWLKASEAPSPRDVKPGEGKLIKIEGKPVACSRDDDGKLTTVSAVCTHMGCLVRWNNAEHTWDCPCHGSRFQATGEVMAGPAESPLEAVQVPVTKAPKTTARSKKQPRRRLAAAKKGR